MGNGELTLWAVRGVVGPAGREHDVSIVVEAESASAAEYVGWRRGIRVVIAGPASPEDVRQAKEAKLFYRYRTQSSRFRCFGRPISYNQVAGLVMCALAVIVLDLRASHVRMCFRCAGHGSAGTHVVHRA